MKNKKKTYSILATILAGAANIAVIAIIGNIYDLPMESTAYLIAFFCIIWVILLLVQIKQLNRQTPVVVAPVSEPEPTDSVWEQLKEKEDFFALWAHQIKTPIAAMNLLLQDEELDRGGLKQEVFKTESYVEMALNYLRFEDMSNDLLLTPHNLKNMVKQVTKKFAPIFIHKHLSITFGNLDYSILTDDKWFVFILEQIISNGLKYTANGGLTIDAVESGDELNITITDTGIGIKSEDIPRLFEKGFTGYNGRMDKKASGLGLYLTQGVCKKLGHGIHVSSIVDQGTTVTLTVYKEQVKYADLTKM